MRVVQTVTEARDARRAIRGSVGLVPTMGYLHEGHLALVRRARRENDFVAVSIFVNPTQFGPNEDFAAYPRDMQRDLAMLESEGVGLVFTPGVEQMYPKGFDCAIEPGGITERLEGVVRPGHFRGVATIVAKLFHVIAPTRAYFGQKDAQQARVIQKMVADLDFDLDVVVVPTVREADGLAMSSRNVYLNPEERQAAVVLSKSLRLAEQRVNEGRRDAASIRGEMAGLIAREPLARIDYISIADAASLAELSEVRLPALVSLAVRIGKTRLIDNAVLSASQNGEGLPQVDQHDE
ncbi:MAG: pantoate--beta-alanine ligase [Chloroflexi bacterium]|nr:pantoate--beta-alanine ligase [Chloroflexota bacterium]